MCIRNGGANNSSCPVVGHVLFEMACGYELTTMVPGEEDWRRVRDSAVLDVLQFIFLTDRKGRFTIKTVRCDLEFGG